MTALYLRGRAVLSPLLWLAALVLFGAALSPAAAAEPIQVALDQARIIKIPERASTVVIGNPLIADLSLQPNGIAVITGKSYGATNVIAMDKAGAVLMEKFVEVAGPQDPIVVVYRGITRETYSCTPDCSARITPGDDADFFTKIITETTARSNQALSAGVSTPR